MKTVLSHQNVQQLHNILHHSQTVNTTHNPLNADVKKNVNALQTFVDVHLNVVVKLKLKHTMEYP